MKRISLILAICMVLSSISGICLVSADSADGVATAVIEPAETVKVVYFGDDPSKKFVSADNFVMKIENEATMNSDPQNGYSTPAFFKFDLSSIDANDDIVKAALIWGNAGNRTSISIYDVPGDELPQGTKIGDVIPNSGRVVIDPGTGNNGIVRQTCSKTDAALSQDDYPGAPSDYNVAFDITSYIKNEVNNGSGYATVMASPRWGGQVFMNKGGAKLWIKTSKKPTVAISAVNSDSEINTEVFDGVHFKITAQVSGVTDITSVKVYDAASGAELGTAALNDDGSYTASVKVDGIGTHTLRVVATAASGAQGKTSIEVNATELIKKNDMLLPNIALNLEKGLSEPLEGTISISSRALERNLYYSYDFAAIKAAGYDISRAWIVGKANDTALGANIDFYRLTEELTKQSSYDTLPQSEDKTFASVTVNSLASLENGDYGIVDPDAHKYLDDVGLGISNYNFSANITSVLSTALESSDSFAFRVFTSDENAEYTFGRDFAICLEYSGKNADPSVAFISPEDDKAFVKGTDTTVPVSFEASDDGQLTAQLFLNNNEIEVSENGGVYETELDMAELAEGTYTLRAVVTDDGYDGTGSGVKTAEATTSFRVVMQDSKLVHKVIDLKDLAQIGTLGKYNIKGNSTTSGYESAVLAKVDISEIKDFDIQKVEIISSWGNQAGNYDVMLHKIYNNDAWDSKTTSFDGTATAYDAQVLTSSKWDSLTLKEKGYEIDDDTYKVAYDITENVLSELETNGNTVTGYLMNQSNNGVRTLGSESKPLKAYVTYNTNKLPNVDIIKPSATAVLPNSDIEIEFTVTDDDSPELGEITAYFDDAECALTVEDGVYKTTVPASRATLGKHIIKIVASDWIGGIRTVEKTIYVSDYSVNSAVFTNADGKTPEIKASETINFGAEIVTSKKEGLDATVMVVLYDAYNSVRAIGFTKASLSEGEGKTVSAEITVPKINLFNAKVKAYIIDDFSNMNLLEEVYTLGE